MKSSTSYGIFTIFMRGNRKLTFRRTNNLMIFNLFFSYKPFLKFSFVLSLSLN